VIADGIKYASGDNVEYSPSGNSVPMLGSAFGLSFVPIHCTADQSDFQDNCWTLDFNLNGIVEENAFTCEPLGFYMDWFVDPDNACESAGGAPCEWTPNCPENTYDCDDPDFNGDDPSCVGHYKYWNYYSNAV
jgi:hypothetical protein